MHWSIVLGGYESVGVRGTYLIKRRRSGLGFAVCLDGVQISHVWNLEAAKEIAQNHDKET